MLCHVRYWCVPYPLLMSGMDVCAMSGTVMGRVLHQRRGTDTAYGAAFALRCQSAVTDTVYGAGRGSISS
eukprot:1868917-Rhodomonas_salina.1